MAKKRGTASRRPRATRRPKASTWDILGNGSTKPRIPRKWKEYYVRLTKLRTFFLGQRENLVIDAKAEGLTFGLHVADAGTDSFDRDFALGMLSSEQNVLYEIDEAINRVINGTYGICELTGKRITLKRLKAVPWTRYSLEAEKQLESQGMAAHPRRLGDRGALSTEEPSEEPEEEE